MVALEVLVALQCAKVASEVLVASRLCIQNRSKGFGGSVSAHTNQTVDFWWIYLYVGVIHKLQNCFKEFQSSSN